MLTVDQALSRELRVVSRKDNVASAIRRLQRAYVTSNVTPGHQSSAWRSVGTAPVDHSLIDLYQRFLLSDYGALRVALLLGAGIGGGQLPIAVEIEMLISARAATFTQ